MGMQQGWQSLLRIDVTPPVVCESFEEQVASGKLWVGC